ncbi:MFS transporter [Paractinoplanes atraurantiacus]|uniref:Major Facilitator Superfamily protein n=1 Tax=Paractinoplanes atraurantiacus TaxID=1036182 RepID=A0A285K180_9ACTN|nr:MFS transporter [Actinoplanes atraurantiacus]SNY66063.1 Major Facilitator Superfamily protein [Actinoplanes atraurantiacus]
MELTLVDRSVRRGRVAASLAFLGFGTALGVWTARIPAIKANLGLTDGRLSIALLAFAAGCIAGMVLIGRLSDRFGSARVLVPAMVLEGVLLVPPGFAGGLVALCVALFLFGATHGTLNIAMNANAIEVQRAAGRPIMSSFHAVYSIGGFLGAMIGSLFARSGAGVGVTLLSAGAAVVALAICSASWLLPARPATQAAASSPASVQSSAAASPAASVPPGVSASSAGSVPPGASASSAASVPTGDSAAPASSVPPGGSASSAARRASSTAGGGRRLMLMFLGVLVLCTLVGEGAAADWSAVYLRDNLETSAGFAAYGYAAFAVMMTVGRIFGDRLTRTLGPVLLVRLSGLLAAVGLGAALLVNQPIAGVVGFGLLGAGLSCIAPQLFTAAGDQDPERAGRALSTVVSIGYLGFLLGPVLIGAAATVVTLPVALGIPVLLAVFVAASAPALRPRDQR